MKIAAALFFWLLAAGARAAELPPPVAAAFTEAKAQKALRVSYSMTFRWRGYAPVSARYDAASQSWTALSGDSGALPPAARRKFENWQKSESAPGGLTYADYCDHLNGLALVEETPTALVYRFDAAGVSDSPEASAVRTRLTVDRRNGGLAFYGVQSTRAFKPDPTSRLEMFVFEQTFSRALEGAPPLMTKVVWRARGTRLLKRVDEDYEIEFSDFTRP